MVPNDQEQPASDTPLRLVQCEACQGEGRTYTGQYEDEREYCCTDCGGAGCFLEEVEPNEADDFDEWEFDRTMAEDA